MKDSIRDTVAQKVCNFVLNHIASKEYRNNIDLTIREGMAVRALRNSHVKS